MKLVVCVSAYFNVIYCMFVTDFALWYLLHIPVEILLQIAVGPASVLLRVTQAESPWTAGSSML